MARSRGVTGRPSRRSVAVLCLHPSRRSTRDAEWAAFDNQSVGAHFPAVGRRGGGGCPAGHTTFLHRAAPSGSTRRIGMALFFGLPEESSIEIQPLAPSTAYSLWSWVH